MAWSTLPAFSSLSASCLTLTGLILATATLWSLEQPRLRPLERTAVDRGRSQPSERLPVVLARVSHVVAEAVARIALVPRAHHLVPGHLRDDRGRGDGDGQRVALPDRALWQVDPRDGESVDE